MTATLHAVDERHATTSRAQRTFASISTKAKRAQLLMSQPEYGMLLDKPSLARLEARDFINELMPLADLPTYSASLRVLNEVRRELGCKDPDLVALRRNLALFLDGCPEHG